MGKMTLQHLAVSLVSLAFAKAYELTADRIARGVRITDETFQEIETEAIRVIRDYDISGSPYDGDGEKAFDAAEKMAKEAFAVWRRGRQRLH